MMHIVPSFDSQRKQDQRPAEHQPVGTVELRELQQLVDRFRALEQAAVRAQPPRLIEAPIWRYTALCGRDPLFSLFGMRLNETRGLLQLRLTLVEPVSIETSAGGIIWDDSQRIARYAEFFNARGGAEQAEALAPLLAQIVGEYFKSLDGTAFRYTTAPGAFRAEMEAVASPDGIEHDVVFRCCSKSAGITSAWLGQHQTRLRPPDQKGETFPYVTRTAAAQTCEMGPVLVERGDEMLLQLTERNLI